MTEEEQWLPVVGYEGLYEVSDHGQVRSCDRLVYGGSGTHYTRKSQILKQENHRPKGKRCGDTYKRVGLSRNAVKKNVYVHKMVLEAFVGPCPDGMECRHLNSNSSENNRANLSWGTGKQNTLDKLQNDTWGSVVTIEIVHEVRRRVYAGERQNSVAKNLCIHKGSVNAIISGRQWSIIPKEPTC